MQIKAYNPKFSVLAWHGTTKYDLTPYLLQVTTHKDMSESLGQFALLLPHIPHYPWDQIFAPMDYIEIRMSRVASTPKIRMRGFISNIRRTKTIDDSGSVRRTWTINGNDYGKLLQKYQIYYAADTPGQAGGSSDTDPVQQILTPMLFENLGVSGNGEDMVVLLKDFFPQIILPIISNWTKAMQIQSPAIPSLLMSPLVKNILSDYQLNWLTLQSMQGGLDTLANQYANSPWCEWFVYDAEDCPQVVHRMTPFKTQSGVYIAPESALPSDWDNVEITDEDIIEQDVGVSDNEVYDYFLTYPSLFPNGDLAYKFAVIGMGEFGTGTDQQKESIEESLATPTNPKMLRDQIYKYGLQIMDVGSPAIPIISINQTDNSIDPLSAQLSINMNAWLAQAYGWAPQMINGTISIKGNEDLTIGRYLTSKDDGIEYYVESVDDNFSISQIDSKGDDNTFSYTQSVGVVRGRSL